MFLSEAPNVRASLAFFGEESADAGRLPELRRHAHSLKNGAGMLHLEHLRLVCTELEHAAATDDAGRVPELTRAALDALDRAVEALQRQGGA
ncbi:Hpt domain-containing protein [uncultured Bilophila sp.]|uniref:Hpt domain-containing protein n=1 Tax=uncultured Bilophila sp. TaxID=529385 RepID=UPI0026325C18|nr:Hpt domain-containing protein [uncultured Bilophila sp.]